MIEVRPNSHHWHQLDLSIAKRSTYHTHLSQYGQLHRQWRGLRNSSTHNEENTLQQVYEYITLMYNEDIWSWPCTQFTDLINIPLDVMPATRSRWKPLRDNNHGTPLTTFWKKGKRKPDFIEEIVSLIKFIGINAKMVAMFSFNMDVSPINQRIWKWLGIC